MMDHHRVDTQSATQILQDVFGFTHFRPGQAEIVEGLINGKDQFVLMPTGGGKSLCYQIPAIAREGTGIVVSPLISLMQDQVNALQANGARAAFYNSSLSGDQARTVLAQLHSGELGFSTIIASTIRRAVGSTRFSALPSMVM